MPEYLAPGVFVEEIDSGSKPIEGVGVSTAAFIGYAKSGEFNKPIFISSWSDFCRVFGEDDEAILLPLSNELGRSPTELLEAKRGSKKSLLQFAEDALKRAADARKASNTPKGTFSDNLSEFARNNKIPLGSEPYMAGGYLAYAVKGFYDNGGGRAYIVRVPRESDLALFDHVPTSKPSAKAVAATLAIGGLQMKALADGKAGNEITVEVTHGEAPDQFRLKFNQGGKIEEFPKKPGDFLTPKTAAGLKGAFAEVTEVLTETRPAANTFTFVGGADAADLAPARLPLANDLAKLKGKEDDFVGDTAERRGAKGLAVLEDVNFVAIPDLMAGVFQRESIAGELGPEVCVMDDRKRANILAVQKELVDYCELLNDRMAILDPIPDLNPQEVAQSIEGNFSCDHGQAALYYPWIKVPDMLNRRSKATIMIPPSGHVAGVWARTAIERGVHKAPANESVKGAVGLAYDVTKGEQEILNPIGVNCIRTFSASGIRIWGARTLATQSNPSWRYVNVRNLFNYLERSIERGMQWVVFEPNDHDLWGRVRRNVSAFLWTSWKEGMLFGQTPDEAFYVKCDEETNPEQMRDLGRLYVEVGVNPVKPAEFVIIRMGQWSGGSEKSES